MTSPFSCFFFFLFQFFFSFFSPGVVYIPLAGRFFVLLSGVFWRRRDRSLFHVSVFPSISLTFLNILT